MATAGRSITNAARTSSILLHLWVSTPKGSQPMADTKIATKRGICPCCDREYALTAKGLMRYHWSPLELRRSQGSSARRGSWDYDCPGVGCLPKSTVQDPIAAAESRGRTAGYA